MPGGRLAERLRIPDDGITRGMPRTGRNESHGICRPGKKTDPYPSHIVIGMDPQKTDAEDRKTDVKYSHCSAHGFYPYRFDVEQATMTAQLAEDNPDFARDWITHSFVFEYFVMPRTKRETHRDMLLACMFLNAKLLFERQVPEVGSYFSDEGCSQFLITDAKWIKNPDNATVGLMSSPQIIDQYKEYTKFFTWHFCWPNKMPFLLTLRQWLKFKTTNIGGLDAQVSSGYAQLAAYPGWGGIGIVEKKEDIAPAAKKAEFKISTHVSLYK
jgi:hypothetical protein